MKTFSEFIKEKNMYYRHVLTYNFSDDDTRSSFVELIEEIGYIKAEDQSTYVLPYGNQARCKTLTAALQTWISSNNPKIIKGDFIQLFYLTKYKKPKSEQEIPIIASKFMQYDPHTKGLI